MIFFLIVLYYFGMVVFNIFAANWIMDLARQSAGISKREFEHYRRRHTLSSRERRQLHAAFWMISRSNDPEHTRKLIRYHQLAMAPSGLGMTALFVSIMLALKDEKLGNIVLLASGAFLLIYNIVLMLVGKCCKGRLSEQMSESIPPEDAEYDPREDDYDPEDELINYNPEDPETYDKTDEDYQVSVELAKKLRGMKRRSRIVAIFLLLAIFVPTIIAFWIGWYQERYGHPPGYQEPPKVTAFGGSYSEESEPGVSQTGRQKPVPTPEQVTEELRLRGFSPQEMPEQEIREEYDRAIMVQEDDFFFEFYRYRFEEGAERLYQSAKSQKAALMQDNGTATEEAGLNYRLYEASADGWYSLVLQVEDVLISAECAAEKRQSLRELIGEIG